MTTDKSNKHLTDRRQGARWVYWGGEGQEQRQSKQTSESASASAGNNNISINKRPRRKGRWTGGMGWL